MMSTSSSFISTDEDRSPNDCSPDPANMHSLPNSMGNATDTMTGLFKSFLRLSVALVVLAGLSTGAAMGQIHVDASASGSSEDGSQSDPYLRIADAIADANQATNQGTIGPDEVRIASGDYPGESNGAVLNSGDPIPPVGTGDDGNDNDVDFRTWEGQGTATFDNDRTIVLGNDLAVGDPQDPQTTAGGEDLTLDTGFTLQFETEESLRLAAADGGPSSDIKGAGEVNVVGAGDFTVAVVNPSTSVTSVTASIRALRFDRSGNTLSIVRAPSDPGITADLEINDAGNSEEPVFAVTGGEVSLQDDVDLIYTRTGLGTGVTQDTEFNLRGSDGMSGSGSLVFEEIDNGSNDPEFEARGAVDVELQVNIDNIPDGDPAQVDSSGFEMQFTSIGNSGETNTFSTETGSDPDSLKAPNLSTIRGDLEIDDVTSQGDAVAVFEMPVLEEIGGGLDVRGGNTNLPSPLMSFGTGLTVGGNSVFTASPVVTFNGATTFEGDVDITGNSANGQINFSAPSSGTVVSSVEGDFQFGGAGFVNLATGSGGGDHNLELNGSTVTHVGANSNHLVQNNESRVIFAGGSQTLDTRNAPFELDRVTVRSSASLDINPAASPNPLQINQELRLESGNLLANGLLDMSGATLIRSSTSSETGRLQDGTSNIAYTGTVSSADTPFRIEYVGSANIPTGDELLPASADSSERTVGQFVVDFEVDDATTTLATDYLYTVTSSLEILTGDLAFSTNSSLRLANQSAFVRGDGRLITEDVADPADALLFPNVADANAGTDGIDLVYVNTTDIEVGIEFPNTSSAFTSNPENVVRNVFVHPGQENEGDVTLRDQSGVQSTYRLNGNFVHGAGTFDFNGQNLEADAQNGAKIFAIVDSASVNPTDASTLRFIGPDYQEVAGVHQPTAMGNNKANTYNLPTTVVEKDPTGGRATIAFRVLSNPMNKTNGIQINGDFRVEEAGKDLSAQPAEGFLAGQLDEFTVTENFTQNAGSGVIVANSSFEVTNGDLTKATNDSSTVLISAAGERIDVGGDVTHTGATDSLFVNSTTAEGGLVMWTVGTSNESTIDIGGSVTQDDGYMSMATTVGTPSFTPQVNVDGDVTVNGGQFLFDNPFNSGPVASEEVNIGGELAVNGGQFSSNFLPWSNINRRETLAAGALTVGTGAGAGGAAKADVAEQPEGIVASLYAGRDSYGDVEDDESFSDIGGNFPGISETDDGTETDSSGTGVEFSASLEGVSNPFASEEETESSLSASLAPSRSGPAAKSAHEGDYDRFDIGGATTIETNGRFLLGAHSLEVGGDFTFEGQGDLTTNNSTEPQTGLAGLVTFDSDSEQAITVGDGPNQYLHGVAVDGEEGINLQTSLTLSRASTDTTNTVPDQFDRAFGTLFLERGNVVTGEDSLKITQPTPTTNNDLEQALNADEISANGTAAPQSPVIGGTRNSHIEGALQRAVEDQGGSTGGFVTDGYIYPLGDGENYNGIVLQLPTDLGDTQTFTVRTVEAPGIELPENLTSEGVDSDGNRITLDLNVQTRPYYEIGFTGEEPDEDFNIRAIAGELSGATIDDIKQMRLVQFDTTASEVQEAGRYDFTGDPNDDATRGPNSFVSSVPNIIHEGVDLREGTVIGLASDTEYNLLGPGAPSFTAVPSDQDLNVGESAEVTFTAEDSNTDVADLNFSTSGDVNVSSSSKSGNDFTVTVEPDSADAEESFVQGGADNALDLTVEVTDDVNNTTSVTAGVTVGLQNGDANSSGSVNTADAGVALDAFLENVSLTPVQTDAADQNDDGSVTPFDAAEILQIALGGSSAQVAKADDASAGTVVIGDADRSDGTITLPVELAGDAENVRSVAVEVTLDGASQQEVKNVATNLPSGWIADHESSADGTLKIGMAGSSALSAGEIATIQLQGADDPADETSGTFRLNGSDAQDLEVQVSPESFALNGNYPNPFSTATTISYDLKEAANVSIEVYDILGRKVGTLVNKKQSAGSYEVTLNRGSGLGAQMSSGVYVYRIKAGDFTASEKMTVVR